VRFARVTPCLVVILAAAEGSATSRIGLARALAAWEAEHVDGAAEIMARARQENRSSERREAEPNSSMH
jgi:hypothetical protein